MPSAYVRHIAAGPRRTWDAQVAIADGTLLGWAEFGRRTDTDEVADLGVLVVDPWQRHGIATTLIRELIPQAYAAGVRTLTADVLPSNAAAHRMLVKAFGRIPSWEYVGSVVHYEIDLADVLTPDRCRRRSSRPRPLTPSGVTRGGSAKLNTVSTGRAFFNGPHPCLTLCKSSRAR